MAIIASYNKELGIPSALSHAAIASICLVGFLASVLVAGVFQNALVMPAVMALIVVAFFIITVPKVWLSFFILILPYFLTDSGVGISPAELAVGGFLQLSIVLWLVFQLAVDYRRIVRSWPDLLLLLFIPLSLLNLPVALANDVNIVSWMSEWSLFLLLLYYFPLREYFGTSERDRVLFFSLAAFSTVLQSLYSLYIYKQKISANLMYAYQIEASRSVLLGPMFFLAIVFCLLGIFYSKQWKTRLVLFATTMVNVLALFFTFTRTLWLMLAVCFVLMLFFLTFRQKISFSIGVLATCIVTATVSFTVNPKLTTLAYKLIERRLTTSSKLTGGDYSFETRLVEANSAMRRIKETPIGGQGIRTVIVSWHPVNQFTSMTTFIHIGYLGLVMKLGLPLTILFLSIVVGFSYCSIRDTIVYRSIIHNSSTLRVMSAGVAVITPALYVIIFMSGFFDQRYGVVMSAFLFACTSIVRSNINTDLNRRHTVLS